MPSIIDRIRGAIAPTVVPLETKSTVVPYASPYDPTLGLDWLVTPNTAAGVSVTPSNATRCAPVAQCVRLLADGTGIPVKLYRRVDGAKVVADDHPAHALVHRDANEAISAPAFRSTMTRIALLNGNAYALVNRDLAGTPVEFNILPPSAVTVEIDPYDGPRYRIRLANGGERVEHFRDVLHITSGVRGDDGITGISIAHQAREDIATVLAMTETQGNVFRNNSRPSGIIKVPNVLGDDAGHRMREGWHRAFSGSGVGATAVLEQGAEYQTIQQPFAENEMSALFIQAIVQVCRHFNVPPSLVFEMGRATWSNTEQMNRNFLDYSLAPHLREWTAAYRRCLQTPEERNEYLFEFEVDDFIKSDTVARFQAYQMARSAGIMTANEIRSIENLPAHPNGDDLANPFTTTNTPAPSTTTEDDDDAV